MRAVKTPAVSAWNQPRMSGRACVIGKDGRNGEWGTGVTVTNVSDADAAVD
jgi:hypothetical protein